MVISEMEIRLRGDIARLQRDMNDARRVVGGAVDNMSAAAARAKAALAGMAAGISFAAIGGQILEAQREFDKLNASLITATGSSKNAALAFSALQAFAATTPYSVADATEAFIKMKNLGLDPSERALRSYGNTAAAMGKGLDQMVEAVADAAGGEFERLKEFGIKASQSGDQVALTFRGITKSIGNNASEVQAYLKSIGEVEFGGAMEMRAKTLDGAISGLSDSWGSFLLKLSQDGPGEIARAAVVKLTDALSLLGDSVGAVTAAAITATKVAAAYIGAMVVAPVVFQATATAVGNFRLQLALARMEMASGTTAATLFATSLGGVAVSAQWASGALGKLTVVSSVLFAAFAGWQIGSYLNNQFVEAQIAGEVMAGALLEGWERIKYGGKVAFDALTIIARTAINTMLTASAKLWESFASGLRLIGKDEAAAGLDKFVERVRAGVAAQGTFASRTAEARAELDKNLKVIDQDTQRRVTAALAADKLSEATKGTGKAAAEAAAKKKELTEADKKAIEAATKQATDFINRLKEEQQALGLSESQQRMLAAAKVAALAPTEKLRMAVMVQAVAHDRAAVAAEASAESIKALEKMSGEYAKSLGMTANLLAEQVDAARQEAEQQEVTAATYGMTALQIRAVELARLEEQLAQRSSRGLTLDEIETLEKLIAAKKRSVTVMRDVEGLEEQKRMWESIERTAHDTFISIFDSGKSAFDRLKDALKNGLLDLLYQMTMKKWIMNISGSVAGGGSGVSSIAQAAAGGGAGFGNLANMASSAYGAVTGGMTLAGGLGTGFMGSLAGGLQGAGIGSGLASSSGLALGNGIAGVIGEGAASALGTGLTSLAAAAPYLLAFAGAIAIWKKLDTSGTYHAGGAASATSTGVTAVSASSLNMEKIQSNAATQTMVGQLAQGVVSILDSTAMAFGKTAGYQAATAFADDTSKDGAWGSLVISKLGQSIVNWQDTRGNGKWSQKTFADGEKGQEQYLAALTSSVRTALDSIGLPDWARTMLSGVASDATLEDLGNVVAQINQTQAALGAMRSQLAGFSSMTDSAVSALMAASGGIDKLFASASAYYDAFYTEAEKNSTVNGQIAKQLAAVNLAMPATKEGFRALVEAQMKLGTQGAESVSVLLGVAGAFAQMHPEIEAATKDLEAQRSAVTEAYNREADALQSATSRMGSFATSLRELNKSALLGNLSPLSPQQKYAEAKSQYEAVLSAARGGDEGAQSNYQSAFTSFLEASRTVFASSSQYQTDFAYAQTATEEAARWAEAQVDVGQAQLDVLKSQVSGIIDVNKSVLSVRDALLQYHEAMGKNTMPLTAVAPPVNTPIPYSSYGTSNTEALVAEVKALRTEVSGLRADQRQQTGDLITGTAAASDESAKRVSSAVKMAMLEASANERVSPE